VILCMVIEGGCGGGPEDAAGGAGAACLCRAAGVIGVLSRAGEGAAGCVEVWITGGDLGWGGVGTAPIGRVGRGGRGVGVGGRWGGVCG